VFAGLDGGERSGRYEEVEVEVQQARRWLSVLMELGRLMLQATRLGQLR
jgi:hypothetical protein